jgi:hypothetical protein
VVFDNASQLEDQYFEYFKKQTLLAYSYIQATYKHGNKKKIDNKLLLAIMLSEYLKKNKTLW